MIFILIESAFQLFICLHSFVTTDMVNGEVADMAEKGILESHRVKRQLVIAASEAAEMILRVDDIIKSAPRPRERGRRH